MAARGGKGPFPEAERVAELREQLAKYEKAYTEIIKAGPPEPATREQVRNSSIELDCAQRDFDAATKRLEKAQKNHYDVTGRKADLILYNAAEAGAWEKLDTVVQQLKELGFEFVKPK